MNIYVDLKGYFFEFKNINNFCFDDSCQFIPLYLHRKTNDNDKYRDIMGLNYIINCTHCGSHTEYSTKVRGSALAMDENNIYNHIDTQCAMRCPVCRSRLNSSQSEFRRQVQIVKVL